MGFPADDMRGGVSEILELQDAPQVESGAATRASQAPPPDDFPAFIHRTALPQDVSRSFDSGWPVTEELRTRASDLASSTRTGLRSASTSVRSSLALLKASVPRTKSRAGAPSLPARLSILARQWTRRRLRALQPSGVSWQPSISTSIAAQFVGGLLVLGALTGLIIASPAPQLLKPPTEPRSSSVDAAKRQAWHRAHLVIPVFDIERRVDFSPGLRTLLSSGTNIVDGEVAPSNREAKADAAVPVPAAVPGVVVASEAGQDPRLTFVPGALPTSPDQAFRMSASLLDSDENAWAPVKAEVARETASSASVAALPQTHQQTARKLVAAARPRKIPQKKALAMRKPQPSMITTGSTPSPSPSVKIAEPASPSPLFPFLSLFAPQASDPKPPPPPGMPTASAKPQAPEPTTPSFGIFY